MVEQDEDLRKIAVDCYNASVNVTDRIKTFKDACYALDISTKEPDFEDADLDFRKYLKACYKLSVICRALNEGWKPNWEYSNERKYYPWFNMQSGFSLIDVISTGTDSGTPGRLVFKTKAVAKYAATQFLELYKDYYKK